MMDWTPQDPCLQTALVSIQTALLDQIQGDLSRIVYLSTLRDNNTGVYLHPTLSPVHGVDRADCALAICHRDLFMQLVPAPLTQYVEELKLYMRFANVDIVPVWRTLEPYRGTIPLNVPRLLPEIYFHNIETALLILDGRSRALCRAKRNLNAAAK